MTGSTVARRSQPASQSEPDAGPALELAARHGVHRLPVPTPWAVGRVNAYLIQGERLTLVDSGPNSALALSVLEAQLEALGLRVEDLDLIVVSHQHVDHYGLSAVLAERSGAEIAALAPLADYLADHRSSFAADDAYFAALMRRHGIEPDIVTVLESVATTLRSWGSSVKSDHRLADGSRLTMGDKDWLVMHRPGHSPTDTLFYEEGSGLLLAADHLIRHISSNPIVTRPPGENPPVDERPQALVSYLDSLRRTREIPAQVVLTGHGAPITDHASLIDDRVAMHLRRAERLLADLEANGPQTAFQLARNLFGDVALQQAMLTLSEVLGHMDLLIGEGRVRETVESDVARFEAVS